MALRETRRETLAGMAGPVKEVVADLLGGGTQTSDLRGYIIIGLRERGFQLASNVADDAGELVILRRVVQALAAQLGEQEATP